MNLQNAKIAVLGLGYVGLPLAVEFSKHRSVIGFDIDLKRISELQESYDATLEISASEIEAAKELIFTSLIDDLHDVDVYIVTVPTPIDEAKAPDLARLREVSKMISGVLRKGNVVIYESTVYPGATEEVCVPILEAGSSLVLNNDFFVGYSPERINPGDKVNTLTTIKKITSGSTEVAAKFIDDLYKSIISAGTHRVSSIKVAEAAKVIENTQRDLNIAVINEFSKIFNLIGIDSQEVLEAAGTKWNFLSFKPGLVGGHCISVDPYYLTFKARMLGYQPEVILAGRRINDGMGVYVATRLIKEMSQRGIRIDQSRILLLGFTFKGDCPDIRNTQIINIFRELKAYNAMVDIYDSWADRSSVKSEYGVELVESLTKGHYDALVLAVDHSEYKLWGEGKIRALGKSNHVLYDVKHSLPAECSDIRL